MKRLLRQPLNAIKLDHSFVGALTSSLQVREVVRFLLQLGGRLGMDTIAEGVETIEVAHWLLAAGCRKAQGHWIASPMAGADCHRWAQAWQPERFVQALATTHPLAVARYS